MFRMLNIHNWTRCDSTAEHSEIRPRTPTKTPPSVILYLYKNLSNTTSNLNKWRTEDKKFT